MTAVQRILTIALLAVTAITLSTKADYRDDSKAVKASGGEDHTLVLTADKGVWACGPNGGYDYNVNQSYYGVLGTGSDDRYLEQKTLARVHGANDVNCLEGIDAIDAGWKHSLALDVNGLVWSWGWNSWGQLGVDDDQYRTTPVLVFRGDQANDPCESSAYLKHIIDISAGRSGEFSLAVDANGYVYAWGRNAEGQLGNGESGTGYKELVPAQVHGVNDVEYLANIIAVSAGAEHGMALEAYDPCDPNMDGRVYAWGDNDFVLGGSGVLGIGGSAGDSNTPVCVLRGEQDYNEPDHIYLKDIVAISAGWDHCMALEKYDEPDPLEKWADPCGTGGVDPNHMGRVYTWGNNGQGWAGWFGERTEGGRLGDGTTSDSNIPVLVLSGDQDPCSATTLLEHIIAVSAGEGHSMALDVEGYVYCWGDNQHGQLGDGSTDQNLAPVKVVGEDRNRNGVHDANEGYLENIVTISAGYWHSLAIDANGVIWAWGKTKDGRLGLADMGYADPCVCPVPHRIPVVYDYNDGGVGKGFAFSIADAINDANEGDVLEASWGVYYENVVLGDESITLKSENPQDWAIVRDTVIDARYNKGADPASTYYPAVDFNDSSGSTLAGLTLVNATRGGVVCEDLASAAILNCSIHNNEWNGITLAASSADIQNCDIRANISLGSYDTHGVYCESGSDVNITNCAIAENDANGIVGKASNLDVKNCIVENNAGHGIYEYKPASSSLIANSMIRGNADDGIRSTEFDSGPEIKNNWIHDNGGSGIKIWNPSDTPDSNAAIVNNTIVNNDANGILSDWAADAEIMSCIIWSNGSTTSDNLHANNGTFTVGYSCVDGSYAGPYNISSDPCFVDVGANDYHLESDSPCIDTGDPDFEAEPNETDIDSGPRVINERVDMGADEFWPSDFNMDGIVNFIDYAMLVGKFGTDPNDPNYNDDFDIADNDSIDFNDVMVLCQNWLFDGELWLESMPLMGGQGIEGIQMVSLPAVTFETAVVEETPAIVEPVDYEYLLDWLAEVWLDPEVQECIDAEAWLRVYRSLEKEAEKLSR